MGTPFGKFGPLLRLLGSIRLLPLLLWDLVIGRYRRLPVGSILTLLVPFVYLLVPTDIIADFLPGLGQLDDAAVIALCAYLLEKDLTAYRAWRDRNRG